MCNLLEKTGNDLNISTKREGMKSSNDLFLLFKKDKKF